MPAKARRKFGATQKERIFFACLPDAETAARIAVLAERLAREHGLEAARILPEHLHVTLFHLGDWQALPTEIVTLASEAAGRVSQAPFDVVFDRAESFRNRTGIYPFVLSGEKHASKWSPLHSALGDALTKAGLGGATKGEFSPHVTLAYDKVRVRPLPVVPVTWKVRDFVLIHSLLGKTTHNHLGRWPLQS